MAGEQGTGLVQPNAGDEARHVVVTGYISYCNNLFCFNTKLLITDI